VERVSIEAHPTSISLTLDTFDASKVGGVIRRMLRCPGGRAFK
jgi:hypothetical protein